MRTVRSQASSQPSRASSSRMRISSATASAGWVSLSWMATLSGRACQSLSPRRKRRDDVGQRAGAPGSIPGRTAASWPGGGGVVGVEHARQRLGRDLLVDGADEIAVAELAEVEVIRARPRPTAAAC